MPDFLPDSVAGPLAVLEPGGVVLRRATADDVGAIVGLIADDQLGATRDDPAFREHVYNLGTEVLLLRLYLRVKPGSRYYLHREEWEGPDGSTVMDLAVTPGPTADAPKAEKEKPKPVPGNTSSAAKSILEKYMRRPRPTT